MEHRIVIEMRASAHIGVDVAEPDRTGPGAVAEILEWGHVGLDGKADYQSRTTRTYSSDDWPWDSYAGQSFSEAAEEIVDGAYDELAQRQVGEFFTALCISCGFRAHVTWDDGRGYWKVVAQAAA